MNTLTESIVKFDENELENMAFFDKQFAVPISTIINKSLFKLFPINFAWCDTEGKIMGHNQACLDFFKNRIEEGTILGKNINHVISKMAVDNTYKVLKTGIPILTEEVHTDEDGTKIYFLSMKSPIKSENESIIGVATISIDITDRKLMEIELQETQTALEISNQKKTEFLHNMRHDLRTPFSGILSIAEHLENREHDPSKKENLGYIVESAKALLAHLNEILEFVQIEEGYLPIIEKEFDAHAILLDVHKMLKPAAHDKNLQFDLNISSYFPKYLVGDGHRLQRILMNVVSNAIKFTEEGHVIIHADWEKLSDFKGVAQFVIDDSGIGIPPEKQLLIFERFTRLSPSHQGRYEGKGLGLNIVKEFLSDMNGQYEIRSDVGKGTIFQFFIPYAISLIPKEVSKKNKILLVEDHSIVAKISKNILERIYELNCEVEIAQTGMDALTLIEANPYDLILLDIRLPDTNGFAVAQQIRAHKNKDIAKIPIVAITAHIGKEEKPKILEAGINNFIIKPLTENIAKSLKIYLPLK